MIAWPFSEACNLCDEMWSIALWIIGKSISLSTEIVLNIILVAMLLIWIRIYEMFNVKDGRDRISGRVDFLLVFCHFYLKSLNLPNTSVTNVSHINWLPYQIPGISNQVFVFMKEFENVYVTDWHFGKKYHFWQHPCRKLVWSENCCNLKLSEAPNFYHLG